MARSRAEKRKAAGAPPARIRSVSSPHPNRARLSVRLRGLPALIGAQISLHSAITGMRMAGPLLLLQSGAPAWQVGVLFASFGIGPLLVAWRVGRYVDTHGYRPPMALALGLALAATLGAWLASLFDANVRLLMLCVAGAVGGAAANAGLITVQRTAARMATDTVTLRGHFAWVGLAPSASNVCGPVAAGVLLDLAGARIALLAMAGFTLLAYVLARLATPPAAPDAASRTGGTTLAALLRNPVVRRMMVIDLLASGGWDAHTFIVPTLGHARGLSATAIGAILGVYAAGVVLVRTVMPWVAHRLTESRTLAASMGLTALLFALYPLDDSALTMAVLALGLGMSIGIAQPMILSAMHQAVAESERGGVLALRTIWVNVHAIVLPVGLAAAVATVGPSAVLWTIAGVIGTGVRAARAPGR